MSGHEHRAPDYTRAFVIGVSLNAAYILLEAAFGFASNSLALLADAGHNLSDVLGLLLSWSAHHFSQTAPTIVFGRLDDMRARGAKRVEQLKNEGYADAQIYDPQETSVRGLHAFFLILGEPEAYGLPPKPQVPTIYLKSSWMAAIITAVAALALCLILFGLLGRA